MTTPTDDEIVEYVLAQDWGYVETAVRKALRLAREGLPVPVKDEARELLNALFSVDGRWKGFDASLATIRTFLTTRDTERDEAVAELVECAKRHRVAWPTKSDIYGLSAALAKLERKP
jgi:ketopantoate reductase